MADLSEQILNLAESSRRAGKAQAEAQFAELLNSLVSKPEFPAMTPSQVVLWLSENLRLEASL